MQKTAVKLHKKLNGGMRFFNFEIYGAMRNIALWHVQFVDTRIWSE